MPRRESWLFIIIVKTVQLFSFKLVPLKDAPYLRSEGRSTVKVCCREGFFAMVVLSIESTSRLVRLHELY